MKRKLVSLYSGCGGLDLGLEKAGFSTVYANDLEPLCEATFAENFSNTKYINGGVEEYFETLKERKAAGDKDLDNVALVAGGPPCPPFSKSRFYRKDAPRALDDPSAEMTVRTFFDIVGLINPEMFLLENVPGISYKSHQAAFDYILERASELGFKAHWKILNAADYGVPQIRQRFFLIGTKNKSFEFPKETHSKAIDDRNLKPWVGCGKVLNDLDTEENADDTGHVAGGKDNHLLKEIPPGDNYLYFTEKRGHENPQFKWRSRYWSFLLKLSPDLPSWTIQARRSNNMGPFHWRNRILRISEVKRIQTFPDSWFLAGNTEKQWRQVGNAVPPLLAQRIGESLMASLKNKKETKKNVLQQA